MQGRIAFIFFCFLFLTTTKSFGQYYNAGQEPANIKWKQINTFNFQIIYPNTFDSEASRLASILKKVYEYGGKTLEHQPNRITVVIHSEGALSNGFVAWAPKRMELFTTPHQTIYAQDWLEQLAIHEFRHVVQIDKIESEMPSLLRMILGQQATALVLGAYVPLWLLEGDAVVAETALTESGRGRKAQFTQDVRAQLGEIGKYSYYKASLGSYKDFVPNHYKMGYYMVGETRARYGEDVWSEVLSAVARSPFDFWNFDRQLKKITGRNKVQLYDTIFSTLSKQYSAPVDGKDHSYVVSPRKRKYINYRYGYDLGSERMVALKTSLDNIPRFILLDRGTGEEQKLKTPGAIKTESVSAAKDIICWAEYEPHIRWTHADKSVVNIYNFKSKKHIKVQSDENLLAPVLANDRRRIAAVSTSNRYQHSLVILDAMSGKVQKRISSADNGYFISPSWESSQSILAVMLDDRGKSLVRISTVTGKITPMIEASHWNISKPIRSKNWIFFVGDYSGVDNIYALHNVTHRIFRVTNSRFGATDPSVSKGQSSLFFSDYTAKGYAIREQMIDPMQWHEVRPNEMDSPFRLAEKLRKQEDAILDFRGEVQQLNTEKYTKAGHLFNIHSWSPLYVDPFKSAADIGISLQTQNHLGTLSGVMGYKYDLDEKVGRVATNLRYDGLFPSFSIGAEYGNDKVIIPIEDDVQQITAKTTELDANVSVPLKFRKGSFQQYVSPQLGWEYYRLSKKDILQGQDFLYETHFLTSRLYVQNIQQRSYQDMASNWGQILDLTFKDTPARGADFGYIWAAEGVAYFPSLFRNHSIKLYAGYQQKENMLALYSDLINFPRGVTDRYSNDAFAYQLNYKLPIAYPEFNIGKLIYMKRLKLNMFYDYIDLSGDFIFENKHYIYDETITSYGGELTADCHFLGFSAPIDLGVRVAYSPELNETNFGLLLNINFAAL